MEHTFLENLSLTCPRCGRTFEAQPGHLTWGRLLGNKEAVWTRVSGGSPG